MELLKEETHPFQNHHKIEVIRGYALFSILKDLEDGGRVRDKWLLLLISSTRRIMKSRALKGVINTISIFLPFLLPDHNQKLAYII